MAKGLLSGTEFLQLGQRYRAMAEKLPKEARAWHALLARESYRDYHDLLSGRIRTRELRKAGHPFAKAQLREKKARKGKRGRGAFPSLPINEQTGLLKRGLFMKEIDLIGLQSFEIGSMASYAKYILDPRGTKKTKGRGLMTGEAFGLTTPGEVERRWRVRQGQFFRQFKQRIRKT